MKARTSLAIHLFDKIIKIIKIIKTIKIIKQALGGQPGELTLYLEIACGARLVPVEMSQGTDVARSRQALLCPQKLGQSKLAPEHEVRSN